MKLLLNDFGGYAFIAQLARELARKGIQVHHCYCDSLLTTPHGNINLNIKIDDYKVNPILLERPLQKYSLMTRRRQEIEYGNRVARMVSEIKPDCVISANTPLDALNKVWKATDKTNGKKVFWLQDIIGLATMGVLEKKLPIVGKIIGNHYIRLEKKLLAASDRIITISDAFNHYLRDAKIPRHRIETIENWAPVDDIPLHPRVNDWSKAHGLCDSFIFLYSGTLSMKHDPSVLLRISNAVQPFNAKVVVRSQGLGADWLKVQKNSGMYKNLIIDDYVQHENFAESLASADVLISVLEPRAAEYSVPSKVLSYLCAGRPILLVAPKSNLAAKTVAESNGGKVVEPDDSSTLEQVAINFVLDSSQTIEMGCNGRAFAIKQFNLDKVSRQFLNVLSPLCKT